ncbi:MAG TPA: hypothetical protein VHD87_15125 [Acidimicrobiales bacterium]|nr:hypothetical protein [Acidimicrobiales bacterium]
MNTRDVLADTELHRAVLHDGRLSPAQWDVVYAAAERFADALRADAVAPAAAAITPSELDAALVAYRRATMTTRYRKVLRAAATSVVFAAIADAADGVATNLGLDVTRRVRRPGYDTALLVDDIADAVDTLSALLALVAPRQVAA